MKIASQITLSFHFSVCCIHPVIRRVSDSAPQYQLRHVFTDNILAASGQQVHTHTQCMHSFIRSRAHSFTAIKTNNVNAISNASNTIKQLKHSAQCTHTCIQPSHSCRVANALSITSLCEAEVKHRSALRSQYKDEQHKHAIISTHQ